MKEDGVYRYGEVCEMIEETNNDEKVITCMNCNSKFKTMSTLKYHYNTSQTPIG